MFIELPRVAATLLLMAAFWIEILKGVVLVLVAVVPWTLLGEECLLLILERLDRRFCSVRDLDGSISPALSVLPRRSLTEKSV